MSIGIIIIGVGVGIPLVHLLVITQWRLFRAVTSAFEPPSCHPSRTRSVIGIIGLGPSLADAKG